MQVIAKTKDGLLIQATEDEVKEILNSINGTKPDKVEIGQKIPAIDYGTTIIKVKAISNDYYYKEAMKQIDNFVNVVSRLKNAVNDASNINL